MPDKSVPSGVHATKRRFAEINDDDSDCEIIDSKPPKRSRSNSSSVSWPFSNFFKRIGDWFKKNRHTNTHLFGVPGESNSAADAIAHGGQYLEDASTDKFMPNHGANGNGGYVNGDDLYSDTITEMSSTRAKYNSGTFQKSNNSRAQSIDVHTVCNTTNSSMYSFPHAHTSTADSYKNSSLSDCNQSNDIRCSNNQSDGISEQMNGSLQKTYIAEAVKHRRASSKQTVYDKSYGTTESPPLLSSFEQRPRKTSSGFDLEEKERYKVLLKQFALKVDSSSWPQPAFDRQRLSLSKLSTNPGAVSIHPSGLLLRDQVSPDLSPDDVSGILTNDATLLPSVGMSQMPQSTPLRARQTLAKRMPPSKARPHKPSAIAVQCNQLVQKMQNLKERSLSRLAEQKELRAEELKLAEWERLRAKEDEHLEKMIQQRLKLSAKVILEDLPAPDVEEYDEFPELSQEAEMAIQKVWQPGPNNVLSDAFRLKITRKDMSTLAYHNWLNDEIVNFYFNLIQDRSGKDDFPSVYVFNTFFYPKIMKDGHKSVRRWTKQVDIFSKDMILIPIHLGMHWCLACINMKKKTIHYFDSMGGRNHDCLIALRQYLEDESLDKRKQKCDTSDWVLECLKNIPQQMNGSDCGVFSCKYAEYLSRDVALTFSQEHMPYFRRRMVYEILTKRLI